MTIVKHWIPSPHHRSRTIHKPEVILLHYSAGNGDAIALGRHFGLASRKASSHYGVSRDGTVAQYVDEDRAAWHAGDGRMPIDLSNPGGNLGGHVNARSIGIEICNRGWAPSRKGRERMTAKHRNPRSTADSWEVYPHAQIDAVIKLVTEVSVRHGIMLVTGHEDLTNYATIGGGSKLDPGPAFPWDRLIASRPGLRRLIFNFTDERFEIL